MSRRRVQVTRWLILLGYVSLVGGLAGHLFGSSSLIAVVPLGVFVGTLLYDWVSAQEFVVRARTGEGRRQPAMTSDQIETHLRGRGQITIDDSPAWGKLVEGRGTAGAAGWGGPIAAVQVRNATAEPDGTYKLYWLRVPARGDAQPARVCIKCNRDIAFPPRTAKEAIAWTFQMCEADYAPVQAT